MTEESNNKTAKGAGKTNGMQLTGIVLILIGLFLTLLVAPVVGLPLLFVGLIVNVIGLATKSKANREQNTDSSSG